MRRMIIGLVVLIAFIITFIIGFVVFDEPISLLTETLSDAYPSSYESYDDVGALLSFIALAFSAAIVTGVIMAMVWFAVWGHKDEYERY